MERLAKQLEVQLTDMTLKSDEQARTIQELTMYRGKLQSDNTELNRLEDLSVNHLVDQCLSYLSIKATGRRRVTAGLSEPH